MSLRFFEQQSIFQGCVRIDWPSAAAGKLPLARISNRMFFLDLSKLPRRYSFPLKLNKFEEIGQQVSSIKFSEVNLISKGESDMTVPVDQVKVLHEAGLFSSAKLLVSQLCSALAV